MASFAAGMVSAGLSFLLLAAPLRAERLAPQDECKADAGFEAYRTQLAEAVTQRSSQGLLALLSPKIQIGFDNPNGPEAFKKEWKLDKGAGSTVWAELEAAMQLGCARDSKEAAMPFMFLRIPDTRDAFDTLLPNKPAITLHKDASAASPAVKQLAWDYLTRIRTAGVAAAEGWIKVKTDAGEAGYVAADDVRGPTDYRAIFGRVKGQWKMTAFLAGD